MKVLILSASFIVHANIIKKFSVYVHGIRYFFLHLPHERIFPSATAGELVVKSLIYIIIMAKIVTFGEIMPRRPDATSAKFSPEMCSELPS